MSSQLSALQALVFVLDLDDVWPQKGSLCVGTSLYDSFVALKMKTVC
jgi:hypothetical protein